MLPAPIYYTLLLLCAVYVSLRGGTPERLGLAILALGSVMSSALLAPPAHRYGGVNTGVLWVDAMVALALVALALRADRYWTLWLAALQLVATASHFLKLADSETARIGYSIVTSLWAYPMLLLVATGAYLQRRNLSAAA
jgi:hypothetical protein